MYLNKATIIGNLTRDPEIKALPSGVQVANFGIATNRTFKDKDGNKQEQVEFHNCVSFGKQAENIAKYMKKGSQLLVEGRLQTQSWEKDGQKFYKTEIIVESSQFGAKPQGIPASNESLDSFAKDLSDTGAEAYKKKLADQEPLVDYPENQNPDDLPF